MRPQGTVHRAVDGADRAVDRRPVLFAGFPLQAWAFAIRVWLALLVALYVSFWLELEAPASAALTVTVLALPTRGQGLEKAAFRVLATILGVAASIAIVGLLVQTEMLILAAFAAWMGLCVYAARLLDGNRAYAAALCAITVAFIAVQQIDTPQNVFQAGLERGAAIFVGILAVALVNDVLAAPDYHPAIAARLEDLHRQVAAYARRAVRGEPIPPDEAARLLREITALRPEVASLTAELDGGQARSAAGRAAMVCLVSELAAARALARQATSLASTVRDRIISDLDGMDGADPPSSTTTGLSWMTAELVRRDRDVRSALDALRRGAYPDQAWRAPLYRSHRLAANNGIKAALYFALAAIFLAAAGWPSTEACVAFVGILIGISATTPDARAFATLALVVAPLSCLLTGLLEFVVLDGVSDFPLLAIGLAPFVISLALLMTLPNPALSTIARTGLIFMIALLAPSNPQTYDPQAFIFACLFLCLAVVLLFVTQHLVPPLSNEGTLRVLLAEAHRDLDRPTGRRRRRLAPEESLFRDAARIGQIEAAAGNAPETRRFVESAMACFDRAAALLPKGRNDDPHVQ